MNRKTSEKVESTLLVGLDKALTSGWRRCPLNGETACDNLPERTSIEGGRRRLEKNYAAQIP